MKYLSPVRLHVYATVSTSAMIKIFVIIKGVSKKSFFVFGLISMKSSPNL